MDLENFRQSDIGALFGHEISIPTAASPHFHFNKMIAMISGRKRKVVLKDIALEWLHIVVVGL